MCTRWLCRSQERQPPQPLVLAALVADLLSSLTSMHPMPLPCCARQDYTKVPGEIPTFLGFKPDDPEVFREKQLKELKNGRLAMIAVLGEMMAQQVSGMGTYEQLGAIADSLPLPF
jgi:hypothetical protein